MKKLVATSIILAFLANSLCFGQTISDVSSQDPSYESINKVVSKGYMKLFSDSQFKPQSAISRKEMALIIDKVLDQAQKNELNLSPADIQELTNLSKTFKSYLVGSETDFKRSKDVLIKIANEQKVLNSDISRIDDELRQELKVTKKELEDQRFYTILGAIFLGGLILVAK